MAGSRSRANDEVERAAASVRRAVARLVGLLGHDDLATVRRAIAALEEVGRYAVSPLAASLRRSPSPRLRFMALASLPLFESEAGVAVKRAIFDAAVNDSDPRIRAAAKRLLDRSMMADLAGPDATVGGSGTGREPTATGVTSVKGPRTGDRGQLED